MVIFNGCRFLHIVTNKLIYIEEARCLNSLAALWLFHFGEITSLRSVQCSAVQWIYSAAVPCLDRESKAKAVVSINRWNV